MKAPFKAPLRPSRLNKPHDLAFSAPNQGYMRHMLFKRQYETITCPIKKFEWGKKEAVDSLPQPDTTPPRLVSAYLNTHDTQALQEAAEQSAAAV
jgi:hypothetical protein